jgi:hypothetical protein
MGKMANCCCDTCVCLVNGTLPTVAISGFTGGAWVNYGTDNCCWYKDFTPNTTLSWTTVCQTLTNSSITITCNATDYAASAQKAKIFLDDDCNSGTAAVGYTCPLPDEYCCDGEETTMRHKTQVATEWNQGSKFVVSYRLTGYTFYISKQSVTCPSTGTACRWQTVLQANYEYCYEKRDYKTGQKTRSITEVGSCFKKNTNGDDDNACQGAGQACERTYTIASDPADCSRALTNCGGFSMAYMKVFDNQPNGSYQYSTFDLGTESCTGPKCTYAFNFVSQTCIQYNTSISNPCWCGTTTGSPVSYPYTFLSSCNPSGGGPQPNNVSFECCDPDLGPYSTPGSCYDTEPRTCGTVNCTRIAITNSCSSNQDNWNTIVQCFNCQRLALPIGDLPVPDCINSFAEPGFGCISPKTYAEDPTCYYTQPCDTNVFKWGSTFSQHDSLNVSITCSGFTAGNVCVPNSSTNVSIT